MKLSKSKLALARVINENGGWVDVADCATQDKDGWVCSYEGKPTRCGDSWKDNGDCLYKYGFGSREKIPNWHQCVLIREEYYQAYPKADADGWIEVTQSGCPVDEDDVIQVSFRDDDGSGMTPDVASNYIWDFDGSDIYVVSYSLHKQGDKYDTGDGEQNPVIKPEFCESVMRSIPGSESIDKLCAKVTEENKHQHVDAKPAIEQLAQDYRNKLDFAKQADDAKVAAYAALGELERAGDELGLIIGAKKPTHELSITDWRDLQVGDIVFIESMSRKNAWSSAMVGRECIVVEDGEDYPICFANDFTPEGQSYWVGYVDDDDGDIVWRFIRRP